MLFLEDIDEGYLVDVVLTSQLRVTFFNDTLAVLNTDGPQCLGQVAYRDCLDPEDVVGVEDGFKVFSGEEVALGEGVELATVRVVLGCRAQLLDILKALDKVEFSVGWPDVQNIR